VLVSGRISDVISEFLIGDEVRIGQGRNRKEIGDGVEIDEGRCLGPAKLRQTEAELSLAGSAGVELNSLRRARVSQHVFTVNGIRDDVTELGYYSRV
jgi:hypothetical protein